MTVSVASKRERAKSERREQLYEIALALFRERGYEATTVDQITQRAGVAKGTFFNYFETKDALLRYLGAREIGRLGSSALASVNGGGSAISKMKQMFSTLAENLEPDRELIRLVLRSAVTVPEVMAGDAGGFTVQPIASLMIRQAQRLGEINAELAPDVLAGALDVLYLQQLVLWCESADPYPLAERLTGIVDLLLLGITLPR